MCPPDVRQITVYYSCPQCGLRDVPVTVPARAVDQGVLHWMHATMQSTCDDHRARSPACHPDRLYDLKIPFDGQRVGDPPVLH